MSDQEGPYCSDTRTIRVMVEKCETCIFRPGNLMYLAEGRVKQMVQDTREDPFGNTPCHDTLPYAEGNPTQKAICKGWWDGYSQEKFWSKLIPIEWWRKK